MIELAKNCKASIKVLHISTEEKLNKEQLSNKNLLEEYFEDVNYSFHSLSSVELSIGINCFIESVRIELYSKFFR